MSVIARSVKGSTQVCVDSLLSQSGCAAAQWRLLLCCSVSQVWCPDSSRSLSCVEAAPLSWDCLASRREADLSAAGGQVATDCPAAGNMGSGIAQLLLQAVNGDAKLLLLQWVYFSTLSRKSPWASMDRHDLGLEIAAEQ